jgi:hypothetical protein
MFQRGNDRESIFSDPIKKGQFIKQIKEYMNAYEFELFAFVMKVRKHMQLQIFRQQNKFIC